jgi:hypothetical protein
LKKKLKAPIIFKENKERVIAMKRKIPKEEKRRTVRE